MTHMLTAFERPVTVFLGLGFPRQIDDAAEALGVLSELSASSHGPAHAAAMKACRAAMNGEIDAETARGVFEAFVRARGMLANEAVAEHALAAKRELLSA